MRGPLAGADEKGELSVPAFLSQAVPGGESPKGSDKASKEAHCRPSQEQAAWLSGTAALPGGLPTPSWQDFFFERGREAGKWGCKLRASLPPELLQTEQTLSCLLQD